MGRGEEGGGLGLRLRIRVGDEENVLLGHRRHEEAALGRRERGERLGAELVVPARGEVLVHEKENEERVGGGPRARRDPEELELEPRVVGMALEERIHPRGVGLELIALGRG